MAFIENPSESDVMYCQIGKYVTGIGWPQPFANTSRHLIAQLDPQAPCQGSTVVHSY